MDIDYLVPLKVILNAKNQLIMLHVHYLCRGAHSAVCKLNVGTNEIC